MLSFRGAALLASKYCNPQSHACQRKLVVTLAVATPLVASVCCMQTSYMMQQGCLQFRWHHAATTPIDTQTDSQQHVSLWRTMQVLKFVINVVLSDCRAAPDTAGSEVLEQVDGGWLLSDQAVLWAKSTVWSRAFNIPYLGQSCCTALHTQPHCCCLSSHPPYACRVARSFPTS